MTLEVKRALRVGSNINLGTDNSVLFIENGVISEDNTNLNFNPITFLLTVGGIETLSTNGIVVPASDTYAFSRKGDPTTGLFFDTVNSCFEFHVAGESMVNINAVSGQGDLTAKRHLFADDSITAQNNITATTGGIQANTNFKAISSGVNRALEIADNTYAFSLSSSLTTGVYFNNLLGNIEFHLNGGLKHTFEMTNGDYTAGRNIIATGGYSSAIATVTANITLPNTASTVLADSTTAAFTITLPTAVGISGRKYVIKKIDSTSNIVKVDADGTETIDGDLDFDLLSKDESIEVQSNGTGWYII